MKHMNRVCAALLCGAPMFLSSVPAPADIYRWVGEDGSVHYGDRPRDPGEAAAAAPVELRQGYTPPARSAEDMAVYEESLAKQRHKNAARREEEQAELAHAREKRESERLERCKALRERVARLTTMQVGDGHRIIHYTVEDGRAVTAQRQREIVAGLQEEMSELGCR